MNREFVQICTEVDLAKGNPRHARDHLPALGKRSSSFVLIVQKPQQLNVTRTRKYVAIDPNQFFKAGSSLISSSVRLISEQNSTVQADL